MKNITSDHQGFTMIEIIVSLLIVGFIGIIVSMGMVQAVNGYIYAKQHTETLQKAQAAMARIVKELNAATSISAPTENSLQFGSMIVYKDGNILKLKSGTGDDILADNISDFLLNYYEKHDLPALSSPFPAGNIKIVEIRIEMIGANNSVFTIEDRVFLRNVVN
jgi:prepilin-type N-terminal cleavage/methylation domain-containing protein